MHLPAHLKSCFGHKNKHQPTQEYRPRNAGKLLDSKKRLSLNPRDIEQVDHQREIIIRKSLASRASSSGTFRLAPDAPQHQTQPHDYDDTDEDTQAGLRCDWKAFEADLQRNRSTLIRRHPGVDHSTATNSQSSSSYRHFDSIASSSRSPPLSNTHRSPRSPTMGVPF